jgi:DnaJ-class molecular chaperone
MTRYIKITVESLPCNACSGQGFRWETLYHNQAKKCKCYICSGTGQREVEKQVDVTEEILALLENKPID